MKVLIIEDERLAADHLTSLIKKYDPGISIIDRLTTVKQGIMWFESNPTPDLAFFDIQLSDGISFEIFENTNVGCPVIFTTAFNEYAIKAFKVNSVDYLLKPIDFEELQAAIDKFKNTRNFRADDKYQEIVNNVFQMLSNNYKERFVIKVGEHLKSIAVSDILYFFSLDKATYMCTSNNRNYVIDYSMEQLESLVDPERYFRINRKYLISLESVEDIISWSNSRLKIELKNNNEIDAIVAREKVGNFKQWLDR